MKSNCCRDSSFLFVAQCSSFLSIRAGPGIVDSKKISTRHLSNSSKCDSSFKRDE